MILFQSVGRIGIRFWDIESFAKNSADACIILLKKMINDILLVISENINPFIVA